jgi:hypothetical protein
MANITRKRIAVVKPISVKILGEKQYTPRKYLLLTNDGFLQEKFCLLIGGDVDEVMDELARVHYLSPLSQRKRNVLKKIRKVGILMRFEKVASDYTIDRVARAAVKETKMGMVRMRDYFNVKNFETLCAIAGLPRPRPKPPQPMRGGLIALIASERVHEVDLKDAYL